MCPATSKFMENALGQHVANLKDRIQPLDRKGHQAAWHSLFSTLPPKNLSLEFMESALAYESQYETNGGLSKATKRTLEKVAGNKKQRKGLSPGTTLVREWNGVPHRVEVVDGGYIYKNKVYTSLTKITEEITGTHWSGPRFFGLTSKSRGKQK